MSYFSVLPSKVAGGSDCSFQITQYTGTDQSGWMVKDGYCFSTFSYDTGTLIPIEGLNKPFPFDKNQKFYIDFTMLPNLQVKKAEIKCSVVGQSVSDTTDPETWSCYPNMSYIQPQDEIDENGRVKTITEGKKQLKCYVLIGYRDDDTEKNGPNTSPSASGGAFPVQVLCNDIILLASMVSGVPVVFPAPYFNIRSHVASLNKKS